MRRLHIDPIDLGVDFAMVDRVVQIGSPKGVARLLQRAGRSGHQPGIVSRVTCAPTSVFELVEDAAARAAGLEQSASRVALEFVIAGDDPNFPGMLEPDLRRTEDVARRVVRDADAAAIHSFTVRQHGDVGGTDPDIEESATGSAARYEPQPERE